MLSPQFSLVRVTAPSASPISLAEAKAQIERTTVPTANPATAINTRVADAIYFVVTSPEFVLQR